MVTIQRRLVNARPALAEGPRSNEQIDAPSIRLIDHDGNNLGVMTPEKGMELALEAGLDLVEISAKADPPVCKILDYGKYKYERQKGTKQPKPSSTKEIKFRPSTGDHDYGVKLRKVQDFLDKGDNVKITVRFRGREMLHKSIGVDMLHRVCEDMAEHGRTVGDPKYEGRQIHCLLVPAK